MYSEVFVYVFIWTLIGLIAGIAQTEGAFIAAVLGGIVWSAAAWEWFRLYRRAQGGRYGKR